MGKELAIAGSLPLSYQQIIDMGITRILAIQDYTCVPHVENHFGVQNHMGEFKSALPVSIYGQGGTQTNDGSDRIRKKNNVKNGDMEDVFMNFLSLTAEIDVAFMELTTMNGYVTTQPR